MEIPDDTKLFLRAVLGSTAGLQQSHVMKEYQQATGEKIQFAKYGFKNVYELLVALEGEVTRLEFSPKHGDNLVYAVLDKTKYASKHAMKYASKISTGMKSKSQGEIILWKKEQLANGTLPVNGKKHARNRRNNRHNQIRKVDTQEKKSKEEPPTVSEWFALRKLLPESDGIFRLCMRNIGVNQKHVKFLDNALYTHFAPYNIIHRSIKTSMVNSRQVTYISFATFFNAYRAWKEKHKTIIMGNRIGLEPAGGNVNTLSTGIYMIFVIHIPMGLLMSTFVTQFAKFPGLISIDPRPREHCAIIGYSTVESAQRACAEVTSIKVNGNKAPITVELLEGRPSMHFGTVNSSLLKCVENKAVAKSDEAKSSMTIVTPPSTTPKSADSQTKEITETSDNLACGFCINYPQAFQMFQNTCRKEPKTSENLPNEIQFIVTHQVEPIRFWGWLMCNGNNAAKKLTEIEEIIASTIIKIEPPHVLPKVGHRGAALFKGGGKECWYRCYVLSSNTETDEIEIFYCDYGNSEVISRDYFRPTYNDVWNFPPQAVPFKMHGFELRDYVDVTKINKELVLDDGHVLSATVVKTPSSSQPHIIEIKDVSYVGLESSNIDAKIIGSWSIPIENKGNEEYIQCGDTLDIEDKINVLCDSIQESVITVNQEVDSRMASIFDYDDEDLVLGLLTEAHNPNLLYLKLGDMNHFAQLQMLIDEAELNLPNKLDKGDILLLKANDQKRRVLLLQVLNGYGKAKVLHVDYGVIEWVVVEDLYQLAIDLQDSPFQARPATLAGIDCSKKLGEAIKFLKSKLKIVIKTNVIYESTSGKVHVELFDLRQNKSINKEMIDNDLAIRFTNITDTDEELSPNMIHLPVKELNNHVPKKSLLLQPPRMPAEIDFFLNTKFNHICQEGALASLNSEVNTWMDKNHLSSEMLHNFENNIEITSNFTSQDVKIRPENDRIPGNFEIENEICRTGVENISYDHFFQEGGKESSNKDEDICYPPPDIIASNKINNIQVDQGIVIDGRKIRICDDNDVLNVDINNKLSIKEVKEIQQKWVLEKKCLLESKEKLEGLMHMSLDDLTAYYKIVKKEKLSLKYRIRKARKYANELENEYEKIVQETNHILSLI